VGDESIKQESQGTCISAVLVIDPTSYSTLQPGSFFFSVGAENFTGTNPPVGIDDWYIRVPEGTMLNLNNNATSLVGCGASVSVSWPGTPYQVCRCVTTTFHGQLHSIHL